MYRKTIFCFDVVLLAPIPPWFPSLANGVPLPEPSLWGTTSSTFSTVIKKEQYLSYDLLNQFADNSVDLDFLNIAFEVNFGHVYERHPQRLHNIFLRESKERAKPTWNPRATVPSTWMSWIVDLTDIFFLIVTRVDTLMWGLQKNSALSCPLSQNQGVNLTDSWLGGSRGNSISNISI